MSAPLPARPEPLGRAAEAGACLFKLKRERLRTEKTESVPAAEALTALARTADRRRSDVLAELDGTLLRTFAKRAAFERRSGGAGSGASRGRLSHKARVWMQAVLRHLRLARADFVVRWRA